MKISNVGCRSSLLVGLVMPFLLYSTNCTVGPTDVPPTVDRAAVNQGSDKVADRIPLTLEAIEKNRDRWVSKNIRDYQYRLKLEQHGFPLPEIEVKVIGSKAETIDLIGTTDRTRLDNFANVTNFDDVFTLLVNAKREGLKVEGQFDTEYGFPTKFRTFDMRNRSSNSYTIENFVVNQVNKR